MQTNIITFVKLTSFLKRLQHNRRNVNLVTDEVVDRHVESGSEEERGSKPDIDFVISWCDLTKKLDRFTSLCLKCSSFFWSGRHVEMDDENTLWCKHWFQGWWRLRFVQVFASKCSSDLQRSDWEPSFLHQSLNVCWDLSTTTPRETEQLLMLHKSCCSFQILQTFSLHLTSSL